MIDDSRGALADFGCSRLRCNFFESRRAGLDGPGTGRATQCAVTYPHPLRNFTILEMDAVVGRNQRAVAAHDQPFLRVVERDDGNLFLNDVLPDIPLGPIREREYPHRLALVNRSAVKGPQFRTLPAWVPLAECIAQRKDPLFGPGALFFTARAADCRIKLVFVERVKKRRRLQLAAASRDAQFERVSAGRDGIIVTMHDEPCSDLRRKALSEFEHLFEFVTRVDMKQRKRKRSGVKRLASHMNQHARILAHRVQQHRIPELRSRFPQNINRFAFKLAKMSPGISHTVLCSPTCRPHSWDLDSHHHRPARLSSPGSTARVQGAQPILGYPRSCSAL